MYILFWVQDAEKYYVKIFLFLVSIKNFEFLAMFHLFILKCEASSVINNYFSLVFRLAHLNIYSN